MSKRVPLVGDELIAYEEEQNRIKKEEALKATLIKEEESKASLGADINASDPMVIDVSKTHASPDGMITRIAIPFHGTNALKDYPKDPR
jgi:cleavage and polyadenylation specificity factor subunit 2